MAEYIKRSAVFEQFDNADADVCETDDFGGVDYGFGMKNIKELINAIPAADVVEVVRCKDCYQSVVIGNVLHCTYWGKDTDENGYCHEGG
jgi:hypothetical protein|nr:MAG TPA: hypothetical protein [Caudoviricetes sp.]